MARATARRGGDGRGGSTQVASESVRGNWRRRRSRKMRRTERRKRRKIKWTHYHMSPKMTFEMETDAGEDEEQPVHTAVTE